MKRFQTVKAIDFIPAISGLIGKTALVGSFALVWSKELGITTENFVFENIRIELIIGSIITLLALLLFRDNAPPGTLAPLVVLIPGMVKSGVHPFVLGLLIGIIGLISVKIRLFDKLLKLTGNLGKSCLALVFGISGIMLSLKNLNTFFGSRHIPLILFLLILLVTYLILTKIKYAWIMIPTAALFALLFPLFFGIKIDLSGAYTLPRLNPYYWWNDMWGIGFGLNLTTIVKTLPYALFSILLWTTDIASVKAVMDASYDEGEHREEININRSFLFIAVRNAMGALFGGAQTASLWRSFLIPLYMVKRPLRNASIILGILGILAGLTAFPIKILSFTPLIWSVLLFGIYVPFVTVGAKSLRKISLLHKGMTLLLVAVGLLYSPIWTWIGAVCFDWAERKYKNTRGV